MFEQFFKDDDRVSPAVVRSTLPSTTQKDASPNSSTAKKSKRESGLEAKMETLVDHLIASDQAERDETARKRRSDMMGAYEKLKQARLDGDEKSEQFYIFLYPELKNFV